LRALSELERRVLVSGSRGVPGYAPRILFGDGDERRRRRTAVERFELLERDTASRGRAVGSLASSESTNLSSLFRDPTPRRRVARGRASLDEMRDGRVDGASPPRTPVTRQTSKSTDPNA